jgi:hypothetical protein
MIQFSRTIGTSWLALQIFEAQIFAARTKPVTCEPRVCSDATSFCGVAQKVCVRGRIFVCIAGRSFPVDEW